MASSWGTSWGTSWGNGWGSITVVVHDKPTPSDRIVFIAAEVRSIAISAENRTVAAFELGQVAA